MTAWYQSPLAGSKTGDDCAAPGRAKPMSSRMRNSERRERGSIKAFLMQRWTVLRMKEALQNACSTETLFFPSASNRRLGRSVQAVRIAFDGRGFSQIVDTQQSGADSGEV